MKIQILITHVWPPIPIRDFDFCAYDDSRGEDSSPRGWGKSPEAALADLRQQLLDDTDEDVLPPEVEDALAHAEAFP